MNVIAQNIIVEICRNHFAIIFILRILAQFNISIFFFFCICIVEFFFHEYYSMFLFSFHYCRYLFFNFILFYFFDHDVANFKFNFHLRCQVREMNKKILNKRCYSRILSQSIHYEHVSKK